MKLLIWACSLLLSMTGLAQTKARFVPSASLSLQPRLFDADWRFVKDSLVQAERPDFDESRWRRLDLPHDWSIEDLPNQHQNGRSGPFSPTSVGATSTGYTVGETGWYRKTFRLLPAEKNKQVSIQFDGLYMEADVWLNGHHLGYHPNGYTPFLVGLTNHLAPAGQANVLAVRVRNIGQNSRWYTGSGIYRHVWLTVAEPVHIQPWGLFITTPDVTADKAMVDVVTSFANTTGRITPVTIQTMLLTPDGKVAASATEKGWIPAMGTLDHKQTLVVAHPKRWSVDTPVLYRAVVTVFVGQQRVDRFQEQFGIRTIGFSASTGFTLNGKRVLLKGGCVHHDNGPLGAAAIDRAEERKVELLKAQGYNAVRTSHNPPSPAFLDACDRLGMLVIDEAFDMWQRPKKAQDYHRFFDAWSQRDLQAMIVRDRNHPSVILWSIGNEINERADSMGLVITKRLANQVRQLDPTRPVTEAICQFWEHPGTPWAASANAFAILDVGGYNYEWKQYESDHRQFPERIMLGTESFAKEAYENWNQVEKHPYVIGDFVWTAMDYMGETAIGHALLQPKDQKDSTRAVLPWPWFNAYCGDLDLIGTRKPQSHYRDVVWRNKPMSMLVHRPIPVGQKETVTNWGWPDELASWTWPGAERQPVQVRVFSRSRHVRLTLNGTLIGEQQLSDTSITASFTVPYQPGVLKAISLENGNVTSSVELRTVGSPKRLKLTADRMTIRADRNDLAFVTVDVVDEQGQIIPEATVPVQFLLSGVGELAGVGNGNPTDMSSFQQPQKNTFRGRCLAILRPKGPAGTITLKASATGLQAAEIRIKIQ
jgi:beta-galactosidase